MIDDVVPGTTSWSPEWISGVVTTLKYLAACCTAKNEALNILEWMAFHLAVGFEHIVVIDHGSTDGMADVIETFSERASVTLVTWQRPGSQIEMMDYVATAFRNEFFWCAFIDCDEYLYPSQFSDIKNILTGYEAFGAVGVHWVVYGSSGHRLRPAGLTIENYVLRSPDDFTYNKHIKSIVKLQSARKAVTSHMFETIDGTVDENKVRLELTAPHGFFGRKRPVFDRLRVNHYHTRSLQDYDVKAARGFFGLDDEKLRDVTRRAAMFSQHDRNEVEDKSALHYERLTRFYLE